MSVIEVQYDTTGPDDAPVLVLSGSLGSTRAMWDPQVAALSDRFRVLRIEHRGHGGSPAPDGPYSIADLAGDVLGVLDRLDVPRVAFCGLSLGGMVGQWIAAHAPERVSALVLCCTSAHFPDPAPWLDRAAAVRGAGTGSIAPVVVGRWFTPAWSTAHRDAVADAVDMVSGADDGGYAACCEAIAAWDGRELLGSITARTLLLAGADDSATPLTAHLEVIAAGIPGARLEVLDGAHLLTVEQAERATALLAEHLAAIT